MYKTIYGEKSLLWYLIKIYYFLKNFVMYALILFYKEF